MQIRLKISTAISRRIISLALLAGFLLANIGIPVAGGAAHDHAQQPPRRCQPHRCGCSVSARSANRCCCSSRTPPRATPARISGKVNRGANPTAQAPSHAELQPPAFRLTLIPSVVARGCTSASDFWLLVSEILPAADAPAWTYSWNLVGFVDEVASTWGIALESPPIPPPRS